MFLRRNRKEEWARINLEVTEARIPSQSYIFIVNVFYSNKVSQQREQLFQGTSPAYTP